MFRKKSIGDKVSKDGNLSRKRDMYRGILADTDGTRHSQVSSPQHHIRQEKEQCIDPVSGIAVVSQIVLRLAPLDSG